MIATVRRGESAPSASDVLEANTLEQLHHDVGRAVLLVADVVDLNDIWVADRACGLSLAEKPLHRCSAACLYRRVGVGLTAAHHLDRHLAADHGVLGLPDRAHATLADQPDEAILAVENPTL